jgi:RimJ/RimL family protein N-acetyltransferase
MDTPFVEPIVLHGRGVVLEPLNERRHRVNLAAAISDGELWNIAETIVPHPDDIQRFFADAGRALQDGRELAFATIDTHTGKVCGSTRFRMFDSAHRRVEIGFTFLSASSQRTHVNTAAKLAMFEHAFDTWGMNRVELLTDVRNARSRNAITRLGATQEGVLRRHMVRRDGHVRDSVIFSVIAAEWPSIRERLQTQLDR